MRSESRSAARRQAHGARTRSSAIATALDSNAASRPSEVAFWSTNTITPTAASESADNERGTAAATGQQDPGSAERGRPDQRVGEAEAAERGRTRERESHIPEQPSAGRRRRAILRREREPGAAVGGDPGAAGEREQREREPDERGVDAQALGDPRADARKRALALRAPEAREGERQPIRRRAQPRRTSMLPMPTSASTSSTGASGVEPANAERPVRVDAVVAPAEQVDLADSRLGVDLERDVLRHRDHQAADAELASTGVVPAGSVTAPRSTSSSPMPSS